MTPTWREWLRIEQYLIEKNSISSDKAELAIKMPMARYEAKYEVKQGV